MDFNKLIARAKNILLTPKTEWPVIAGEAETVQSLYLNYILVLAAIPAVFGFIDWLAIPAGTRAKRIGALHGLGNVIVVAMFAASFAMRMDNRSAPSDTAIALTVGGMLLALVTGWLGGELVERLGVGVDPQANVNAPSSLKRKREDDQRMAAD